MAAPAAPPPAPAARPPAPSARPLRPRAALAGRGVAPGNGYQAARPRPPNGPPMPASNGLGEGGRSFHWLLMVPVRDEGAAPRAEAWPIAVGKGGAWRAARGSGLVRRRRARAGGRRAWRRRVFPSCRDSARRRGAGHLRGAADSGFPPVLSQSTDGKHFPFWKDFCWGVCVQCPRRPEEGVVSPGAGVTGGCERAPNSGPQQE